MAPEVRAQSSARRGPPTVGYDERCDTFSYGMLLWSLMHEVAVPPSSASASRPPLSLSPDRAVYARLIACCWQHDPAMRPSMQEVAAETIGLASAGGWPAPESSADRTSEAAAADNLRGVAFRPIWSSMSSAAPEYPAPEAQAAKRRRVAGDPTVIFARHRHCE